MRSLKPPFFCQVQRSQQYYAHIVLSIEHDYHAKEQKYWIGNIEQRVNGWCFREHIYGILVEVQTEWEGRYYSRPLPKSLYGCSSRPSVMAATVEDRP